MLFARSGLSLVTDPRLILLGLSRCPSLVDGSFCWGPAGNRQSGPPLKPKGPKKSPLQTTRVEVFAFLPRISSQPLLPKLHRSELAGGSTWSPRRSKRRRESESGKLNRLLKITLSSLPPLDERQPNYI